MKVWVDGLKGKSLKGTNEKVASKKIHWKSGRMKKINLEMR
jgi:hypothetical protein